jgi:hypothetical protein
MPGVMFACAIGGAAALATQAAYADIFTWTDPSGRLNISNVEPPKDAQARRIVQEAAPRAATKPDPPAQPSEVEALKERVADLESEIDRARQASATPPPAPVVVVAPVVVAPPPQPAAPAVAYAPPPDVAPCDPLMFGCPAFGYPVNVVVVRTPRFHRFRHAGRANRRAPVVPARPNFGWHRR